MIATTKTSAKIVLEIGLCCGRLLSLLSNHGIANKAKKTNTGAKIPNSFGSFFNISYIQRKYHSGSIWAGVFCGLAGAPNSLGYKDANMKITPTNTKANAISVKI